MSVDSPHEDNLRERERNQLPYTYNSEIISLLVDYVNPYGEDNSTKSFQILDLDELRKLKYLGLD